MSDLRNAVALLDILHTDAAGDERVALLRQHLAEQAQAAKVEALENRRLAALAALRLAAGAVTADGTVPAPVKAALAALVAEVDR